MRAVPDVLARASELKNDHATIAANRTRVRAILNGGANAVKALLGAHVTDPDLPWPNEMLSGLTRLSQKIGRRPDIRVDPPMSDDEAPRKRAEKRERIVEYYDTADRLELQLPQAARWLVGYGFVVWTVESAMRNGIPYPHAALRDPYDCYPSAWGVDQQPDELAVWRRITPAQAKKLYPQWAGLIDQKMGGTYPRGSFGAVILSGEGQWANPSGRGLSIVEFYDSDGMHTLIPEIEARVAFTPNPLTSGPSFVVAKRFAFDLLTGQYDHVIGLMAAMAKINVLGIIAMQDAVFSPTNIVGDKPLGGEYKRGRLSMNVFPPGTQISRDQANIPYQLFEQINRIERQFRLVAAYPIQDDSQSPASWATGAGLQELAGAAGNEVDEYHKVFEYALQDLDSKRLEWDEKVSPDREKPLHGNQRGVPFAEKYRPRTHIKGDYTTRRSYGTMAGLDEPSRLVGLLQLYQAGIIDRLTVQENLASLQNLTRINERIDDEATATMLRQTLMGAAAQGDPKATMAFIETLPESELKTILRKFYTPEDPQLSPEEQEFLAQAQGGGGPADPMAELFGGGGMPDVTTVMSRLPAEGGLGGVQTVGRV